MSDFTTKTYKMHHLEQCLSHAQDTYLQKTKHAKIIQMKSQHECKQLSLFKCVL